MEPPPETDGDQTSASLLVRLRSEHDQAAWNRCDLLYRPLIIRFARRVGMNETDAADVAQEVLTVLLTDLSQYDSNRGSFRGWLRSVAVHKCNEWRRRKATRPESYGEGEWSRIEDTDAVKLFDEAEHRRYVVEKMKEVIKSEFERSTWLAFEKSFEEKDGRKRTAMEIGAELGMSEAAVHTAKSRVLRRLRSELDGLLD